MTNPNAAVLAIVLTASLTTVNGQGVETALRELRGNSEPHTKTHFVPRHFASAAAWKQHRAVIRQRILTSAGLWPLPSRPPVRAVPFGNISRRGYTVEKLLLETLRGFYVGANVYRPSSGPPFRRPAVLIAHGHWKNGRIEHNADYSVPALGAALARNGYVVLAYDMVGYNDTRQIPHKFGGAEDEVLWSFGPFGLQLWNSTRMVDYLVARPDVDSARLAITGASGGGTQTYFLAAVDDRIRLAIPVDMLSAKFQGDDPCEMAPGLRIGTNNVEVAAAMAPRPMLVMSSARDWTSDVPKVEFPAIQEIYKLMRAPQQVELFHVDAEHGYNADQRRAAVAFLGKHFRMPAEVPAEAEFDKPPEEFLVGSNAASSQPGALDREGVFKAWRKLMTDRNRVATPAQRVQLLSALTGISWPSKVKFISSSNGDGFLHRDGADDVVPAKVITGDSNRSLIAVHGDSAAAALDMKVVKEVAQAGAQVLAINLFETGPAEPNRRNSQAGDYLVFHYSDDANRAQDIATAASWLSGKGIRSPRLVCGEGAGNLCRLVAGVVPVKPDSLARERRKLFIPGLLAAGFLYDDEAAR